MKRQDLSAIVATAGAIAIVVIMLLVLFKSEEYTKYLPAVVWLSGVAGLTLYHFDKEEDD